jgi:ribosomal protein L16/L10AE
VQLSIGLPLLNRKIMFEVGGVPLSVAKEALRLAAQKLQ